MLQLNSARIGRSGCRDQILTGVDAITSAGRLVLTSWICNLPGETDEEFALTLSAMREVVARGGQVYWTESLMPLPGTRIAAEPEAYGKAIYRQLTEGRWVVSVTGDGSLGLAMADEPVSLSAPPEVRDYHEADDEVEQKLDEIGVAEVVSRLFGG